MRTANLRLSYTSALLSPAIQTVFGLSYAIGLVYGGHLVADGAISLGDYVAFNSYLTMIVAPVTSIGRIVNMLQRGLASLKRLNALMVQPELPPFDRKEDGVPIRGGIEARHLSYSHPDNGQVALEDVSFTLAPGQKLGIAGKTGSAEGSDNGMDVTHAWFVGYIDSDQYPYAISVLVENGGSGGSVAAPVARQVFEYLRDNLPS